MNLKYDYIDNQILDQVGMTGGFDDVRLAEELGISRVELLERMKALMKDGALSRRAEQFFLTGQGRAAWIPLATARNGSGALAPEELHFEWDCLYIPETGWDRD